MIVFLSKLASRFEGLLGRFRNTISFLSAFVFGVLGLYIASIANDVSRQQQIVNETQMTPFIEFERDVEYNVASEKFESSHIIIKNTGGSLRDFQSNLKTFLYIEQSSAEEDRMQVLLPINSFYSAIYASGSSRNNLARYRGYKNLKNFLTLQHRTIGTGLNLKIYNLIRVDYSDRLGKQHRGCYRVKSFGIEEIGAACGRYFDFYDKATSLGFGRELSSLGIVDLKTILKQLESVKADEEYSEFFKLASE